MSRRTWLPTVLLAVGLLGCTPDLDIQGEWNLTLSLLENDINRSYTGQLSLDQTFDSVQGTGYVLGPGGPDCKVEFDVEGRVLDASVIPMQFDFTKSICPQDELQDNVTITLRLLDEGHVLYGHNTYQGDNQILYASASLRLYD